MVGLGVVVARVADRVLKRVEGCCKLILERFQHGRSGGSRLRWLAVDRLAHKEAGVELLGGCGGHVDVGHHRVGEPAALDVEVGEAVELEPLGLGGQDVAEELVLLIVLARVVVEDGDVVHVVPLRLVQELHGEHLDRVAAECRRFRGNSTVVHAGGLRLVEDGIPEGEALAGNGGAPLLGRFDLLILAEDEHVQRHRELAAAHLDTREVLLGEVLLGL
mmetsp:Transcript_2127/g.4322  ORF Transcript_2127/g.4322 Transcript_2127/m.4322 type:complete len:219 (-) Transcript_2127:2686-3342(-)